MTGIMKWFRESPRDNLCRTWWERSVLHSMESHARRAALYYPFAIGMTVLILLAGDERPLLLSILAFVLWLNVAAHHASVALLRIIDRARETTAPRIQAADQETG